MLTGFFLAAASVLSVAAVQIYNPEPELSPFATVAWRLAKHARIDGKQLIVDVPKGKEREGGWAECDFDLGPYSGAGVCAKVRVSGSGVSKPLHSWNGIKFQFHYVEPETGLKRWRDVSPRPTGDFADVELVNDFSLAGARPKSARLRLGLSEAAGRIVFDLSSLRVGVSRGMFRRVNGDYKISYPPERARRFRGVMSPSRDMTEDDFRTLKSWGANLLRYQMTRNWSKIDDNRDLAEYDRWQDGRLDHLDRFVLPMAERYGISVVIDLHVFPGGRNAARESNMLHDRRYADHFLERWRKIATRFRGRRNVYGYDLVNELNQQQRSDVTDYWNLQREAAEIVRAIDPKTTILIGANKLENPLEFACLSPIRMSNVVYQVHMYMPGEFTHYRVHANERFGVPDPKMRYPSVRSGGEKWDKDYLRKVLQPVRDFQLRHGAKIYAGEFSAAAWCPGADRYLADCISLFEEYGWDWSYHAFRESDCWSVEHEGPDAGRLQPSADNPRKQALLNGFSLNDGGWEGSQWLSVREAPVSDYPSGVNDSKASQRAADGTSWFVADLVNGKRVKRAVWTTTALGVYDISVNGKTVGEDFLKPGYTHVKRTRHSFSYDVTELMRCGAGESNRFAAEVSAGWWRDKIVNFVGKKSAFRGILDVECDDGTTRRFGTNAQDWKAGIAGPVLHAGIFDGEIFDARQKPDVAKFDVPEVNVEFGGVIRPCEGAKVTLRRDLAVRRGPFALKKGEKLVVDFGQNMAAVPEFVFWANRGTRLVCLPGEMTNDADRGRRGCDGPKGSVYRANLRGKDGNMRLEYVFCGEGVERYHPRFTYFGYRYVELSADDDVEIESVASVPVTSVTKEMEIGSLETGDAALNQFARNVYWGQLSNYLSVPTDCPQRAERLGWTADTQVFADAGAYNADTRDFLRKWMGDLRDGQSLQGGFPGTAPYAQSGSDVFMRFGWSDAGIIVPWKVWRQFGDRRIVDENWSAMERFMSRVNETRYELAAIRDECKDYQWADWVSLDKFEMRAADPRLSAFVKVGGKEVRRPGVEDYWRYLGGCYWAIDAGMMADMAAGTGRDAAAFRRMEQAAKSYLKERFLASDGSITNLFADMQTPIVFALKLNLLEGAAKERAKASLREDFARRGNVTGFLGSSILMDTLCENGLADLALDLMLSHKFPSWLYSVDQGATTVWERWDGWTREKGFGAAWMNSYNHYAYGAVLGWMYRSLAGIAPDAGMPGFRKIVMRPIPDRRLGFVKAAYRSAAGLITSHWRYEGEKWIWEFTVPHGATASVTLPGESSVTSYGPGSYRVALSGIGLFCR